MLSCSSYISSTGSIILNQSWCTVLSLARWDNADHILTSYTYHKM
jgi:hypothetical protein